MTDSPETIFETYRGPLLSLCLHLTGDRHDAEDAAQETFVAVFNGLSKFRGDALRRRSIAPSHPAWVGFYVSSDTP